MTLQLGSAVVVAGGEWAGARGTVIEIEHRPPAGHDRPGSLTYGHGARDHYTVHMDGSDKVIGGFAAAQLIERTECANPDCDDDATMTLFFVDDPDDQGEDFCEEHGDEGKLSGLWAVR